MKKTGLHLSNCDWQEIYSAIETKTHDIENGDLGGENHDSGPNGCHPGCEACENELWIKHLKSIMQMIGDDGGRAITLGVLPSGRYKNPNCQHDGGK